MFRKLLISLIAGSVMLAACTPAVTPAPLPAVTQAPPSPLPPSATAPLPTSTTISLTYTDGLGRTLTFSGPAQRVVSLAASNTEILYAVGAGAQVVGRDEASNYPEAAASVPTVGGWGGFSNEAIVALKPDLVLAGGITSPELVASLEQLGLTVYLLPNPTTLEELFTNLETVGALTGHDADAATLVASLKARVAAVDAKVATVTSRPTVFYEFDATDPTKPYTYGPGTFGDLLIQRAGGTNIGAQLPDPWAQISLEQLVVANPEMLLLGDAAYGETPEKVSARPGWETLSAIKTGKVFPFNDDLVSRPGPRLVDGLEALAKLLHPELFK
jgi:iron complex transport system substrate-binding protein